MSVGIAINGFGRIGRNIVRQLFTNKQSKQIKVVAINDLTDPLTLAHLLKYDSVHGRFPGTVEAGDGFITVNGQQIKVLAERDPAKLPWGALGASIVLECTGLFTQKEKAKLHMQGGAKKVLISAPAPDPGRRVRGRGPACGSPRSKSPADSACRRSARCCRPR